MTALELVNLIAPTHSRTSCSDENPAGNGLHKNHRPMAASHTYRCGRCCLLDLALGRVEVTDDMKEYFKIHAY